MIDDDHLDEFDEKYKIQSARNRDWDYSSKGIYYLTICCWKHNKSLGKIENGEMMLSTIGKVTNKYLLEIPKHFNNVKIDEYVIMPNHVHILIEISKTISLSRDVACNVSTKDKNKGNLYFSKISPKKGSIPTIVRSFKSAVTRYANQNKILFAWQSRYYDEIIKDNNHYWSTKKYIQKNIKNWERDEYST